MSLENRPKKHILLWCSPGFGLIDIWLPVIKKLKEKDNIKIDFVFPEPSSIQLESINSTLFNLAEQFVDDVIYRSYSGQWFIAPTLIEARSALKFSKFDEKMAILSARLTKGKMSKYFVLKLIGRYISIISNYIIRIKENFWNRSRYDFGLLRDVSGILCDIVKEGKFSNKELRNELKNIQKFSMFHGIAALWVEPCLNCKQPIAKRSDVVVYSMSDLEFNGYKKCFGILEKNIIHAGIPRHDKDWIEFIVNNSPPSSKDEFDSFVMVIGRPASPYNTVERKKKALKDIYDIICIKHKLKLVVKSHPKESLDGIDGDIYTEALGLENYGKTWIYSDRHPFVLGKKAIFSIAFFSGVPVDMLAINKPTIEYLNLSGLPLYDNSDSLRSKDGEPVFQFRYTKLLLGVSSRSELESCVDSLLNQKEDVTALLYSKYKYYFEPFDAASKFVANDIYKKITFE